MDLHPFRQRTFKQRATMSGVGLHSGARVRLTLAPRGFFWFQLRQEEQVE